MNKDQDKIKELISSYIDGAVSEEERRQVEDLILSDRQWQDYYKEIQRLSGTLQEWRDEEVSADMATEIQKTLLDEKLREGATMKSDTWLKVGGGAVVTFAICMIIGIVYLRTYTKEAKQGYIMKSQPQQSEEYEPYYLQHEQALDEKKSVESGYRQTFDKEAGARPPAGKIAPVVQGETAGVGSEYDLAASYSEVPRADKPNAPAAQRLMSKVQPERAQKREAQKLARTGGFQESRYDPYVATPEPVGKDADPGRTRGYSGFKQAASTSRVDDLSEASVGGSFGSLKGGLYEKNERSAEGYEVRRKRDGLLAQTEKAKDKASYNTPVAAPGESALRRLEYADQGAGRIMVTEEEVVAYGNRDNRYYYDDYDGDDAADELYYPHPQPRPYPKKRPRQYYPPKPDTEEYDRIYENPFLLATTAPLSTFSIDVDTAAYSNVRRFLNQGQLPPADAVRIEEMVNYFDYNYPRPKRGEPFSVTTRGSVCPWNPNHLLVQVGLKGNVPSQKKIPPSNLVFLVDVSGSMNRSNKLPLLKQSLKLMVDQVRPDQKVAIVTYSGSARLVLDSTPGTYKQRIHAAIDNLSAAGSTAGEAGLRLAYRIAKDNFIRNGNNRVILATDGDFNVGMKNDYELVELIKSKRRDGIFLSILGFGSGNYKDAKMEKVADNGNGNYYYIDSLEEGRKVLVNELGSTLYTIAKDVKIQVEFNPQHVHSYRLIGYENRIMSARDFRNDRVDAGEIGAGHTVTALYEIVPAGGAVPMSQEHRNGGRLKYQKSRFFVNQEMMTLKLRYKPVKSNRSRLIRTVLKRDKVTDFINNDLAFASAVAEFGMVLRNSRFRAFASYDRILERASRSRGADTDGRRAEFIRMVETAKRLDHRMYQQPQPHPYPYSYPGYQAYPPEHVPPIQFK